MRVPLAYNLVFVLMCAGVVGTWVSIAKMQREIAQALPRERQPNVKWWNPASDFQLVRSYRTIPERSRWLEIYWASRAAVLLPLLAAFSWGWLVGHK
jgi:hypothetical protein